MHLRQPMELEILTFPTLMKAMKDSMSVKLLLMGELFPALHGFLLEVLDYNPLSPKNDQCQFSPKNIHTLSRQKVRSISKLSPKGKCFNLLSNSLN